MFVCFLSLCLFVCLFVCLSIYLSSCSFSCLFVFLFFSCLFVCLSICPAVCLHISLSVCLSVFSVLLLICLFAYFHVSIHLLQLQILNTPELHDIPLPVVTSFSFQNGNHMFWTLYEYGQLMTNGPDHYAALSHTLALLSLSLGPELVIVDSVRIVLGLQVCETHQADTKM